MNIWLWFECGGIDSCLICVLYSQICFSLSIGGVLNSIEVVASSKIYCSEGRCEFVAVARVNVLS